MFGVPLRASSRTGGWRRQTVATLRVCWFAGTPVFFLLALDRFLRAVADRDLLRALHRRLWHMQLEYPVFAVGHDLLLVDSLRQGERARERAVRPLAELRVTCLDRSARAGDRKHVVA